MTHPRSIIVVLFWLIVLSQLASGESVGLSLNPIAYAAGDTDAAKLAKGNINVKAWTATLAASGSKYIAPKPGLYFVNGTIETDVQDGCGDVEGAGCSHGYSTQWTPTMTGNVVIFQQLAKGQPIFRVHGAGFCLHYVQLIGGGIEFVPSKNNVISVGRAVIDHVLCRDSIYFIHCAGGYMENGVFVPWEAHCDLGEVSWCECANVDKCFWSENQQALGWQFTHFVPNIDTIKDATPHDQCTVFDVPRGGMLSCYGLYIEHPRLTVLHIHDYSQNQCDFAIHDIRFDCMTTPGAWVKLVSYDGDAPKPDRKYKIHFEGFSPPQLTDGYADNLFDVPANLPRDRFAINVTNLTN